MTDSSLRTRRLQNWCQTPADRIPDAESAAGLINRVGIATLYPASPEVPNLYHAFVGTPDAPTDPKWDSPSGKVYAWRWDLGRREAAFYTAIVRKRPTWVSWELLPAVIRLRGEPRTPDELFDAGVVSSNAYKIAQALENAGGTLSTGELRRAAGFPTGKEQRNAYLKAIEELDSRMMLAKVFSSDASDMSHALVSARYPVQVDAAEQMTREQALRQFLLTYLPQAIFALPAPLARDLKLPQGELRTALERMTEEGLAMRAVDDGQQGAWYEWKRET